MTNGLRVVMLLDNHYAPDPRVKYEAGLLREAGFATRVVAWDRRSGRSPRPAPPVTEGGVEVVRIPAPAAPGGGPKTFAAMTRFGLQVWRHRKELFSDADVLVVHDIFLLPLASFLAHVFGLPLIYDAHEDYAAMEAARLPRWWCSLMTRVETLLARRLCGVVVPGTVRVPRWTAVGISPPVVVRNLGEGQAIRPGRELRWDLAFITGTLADERRPDIFLDVAKRCPEKQFAIAGDGRAAQRYLQLAAELPNVEILGWVDDPVETMEYARAVLYGLDPTHPYSEKACPNTLFQAIRAERPLIFYCGGEPLALLERFRIGVRCDASPASVIEAMAAADGTAEWEFQRALRAAEAATENDQYVALVARSSRRGRRESRRRHLLLGARSDEMGVT